MQLHWTTSLGDPPGETDAELMLWAAGRVRSKGNQSGSTAKDHGGGG